MNDAGSGKASEDRVAQAMQAIMQLREETEVLARTYGVPDDASAEEAVTASAAEVPADEAPEEAADEVPEAVEVAPAEVPVEVAEQEPAPARPRPAANRYDTALEVIHTEAIAGLRALAGHGFRAGSSFLELWRGETGEAIAQWRSRAADTLEEAVQGAEQSLESATADLASARKRLSDLGS